MQKECVKMCYEESGRTLDAIHQESVDMLTRELRQLGFDVGSRVPPPPPKKIIFLIGVGGGKNVICTSYITSCWIRSS